MRRADLAEAVLSLAAPRERAGSIAGDFLEDDLGGFRFWFLVGRTATAQAWRQLAAEPKALAGIAIRGMIAQFGYLLAACIVYVFLLLIVISILRVSFHTDIPDWGDTSLQWSLANLLAPFWLGRWMARRYGGRAASGTLALTFLHAAINLCAGLLLREAARTGVGTHIDVILGLKVIYWDAAGYSAVLHSAILYATVYPVVVLAGAAFFRASHSGSDIKC
jgi:hypothetical protein